VEKERVEGCGSRVDGKGKYGFGMRGCGWKENKGELPGEVETQEIACQQGGVAVFLSRLSFWLLIELIF
jgi:hypothetical protein